MKILSIIFIGLLVGLLSFSGFNAQAKITVSSVSNASNDIDLADTENILEIMAGISGKGACTAAGNPTTVFNSCAVLANRGACNFRTACSSTKLSISLASDNTSGRVVLVDSDNNLINRYTTTYTLGNTFSAEVAWSTICAGVGSTTGDSTCSTPGSKTLKLGVDSNGDDIPEDFLSIKFSVYGIQQDQGTGESLAGVADTSGVADYTLFPGDSKAYVTDFSSVADYTATSAATIVGLRGFFAPTDCATVSGTPLTVNNASDSYLLDIDEDNKEITDNRIDDGLSNNATYVFMFGFQDKAGNIGLFKDLAGACIPDQHSVQPQQVFGLLEENQNCFISTAAFGSPLNAKVKTFKLFRDQILKQFSLGQKFIQFYYKNSPPIAHAIAKNEFLRTGTRTLLWPLWAVSEAVLYMGLMPFMFVVTMVLLSFVFLREKKSKKKSNKNLLIFFILFFGLTASHKTFAQDDYFSEEQLSNEAAPNEPPYSGTENDEFSDTETAPETQPEEYKPDIPAPIKSKTYSTVGESPDKWKPYQRVPDENRLEELSERGLFKITKKGGFQYRVDESPQNSAASFRFGVASFPNLQNASGIGFDHIYGEDKKPILLVDYEWQFYQGFGKLGLKVESGLMLASGKGQFATPYQGSTDAMEKYTFYMFPNSLAAIYRLDLFHRQWLVPFGEVGIDYLTFIEARDDGNDIKFGGAPHFHIAVGGSFLLDTLNREAMVDVDKQYGVNHIWLTAEYRRLESLGANFDFSDDLFNAGIMVEF